jgi:uncharacterized membrane-anchored protein
VNGCFQISSVRLISQQILTSPIAMKIASLLCVASVILTTASIFSQNPKHQLSQEERQKIVDSLKWQTGSIPLSEGRVTVTLKDGYRFLNAADARKVLTDLWQNPPSNDLGMIFPDEANKGGWSAVVENFAEEGYVKDDDADKLNPDSLLKEIQDSQKEANEQNKDSGYAQLEIVGWAMKPKYDKEAKKVTWATDLRDLESNRHSINYYVRILGRRGYLVVNVLGHADSLPAIEKDVPNLLTMIDFNEGHRYADFNGKTDKVAAYGIAGLIAAAVGVKLLKLGFLAAFFKPIWLFLLAAKKLVIAGVIAIGAFIKKLFGKKSATT